MWLAGEALLSTGRRDNLRLESKSRGSYLGTEPLNGSQEGHGQCLNDEGGAPKCPGPEDNIVAGKQLVDTGGDHLLLGNWRKSTHVQTD